GQKLITQFQNVMDEAKKIEAIVESSKGVHAGGTLTVGIIPTIAPYLLPPLLSIVEKNAPQMELTVMELQTHRIVDALNNDEIDVGVLAIPLKIPKIYERSLYYEPFSVLCKRGHDLSRLKKVKHSSLNPHDIWLLEEGHCLRNQMIDVCSIKQKDDKRKYKF